MEYFKVINFRVARLFWSFSQNFDGYNDRSFF